MDHFLFVWYGLFLSIIHYYLLVCYGLKFYHLNIIVVGIKFIVAVLLCDVCRGTASCQR